MRPVVSTHRCHETSCIAVARHLHRVTSCRVSHAQTPNQTNPLHAIPCAAGWSKNPKVRATYQVLSPDHDHAARSPRMPVGTLDRVSPPPWSRHSHRARIERAFKARQLPYRRFRQLVRTVSTGQCCRWDAIEPRPCNPQAPRAAPANRRLYHAARPSVSALAPNSMTCRAWSTSMVASSAALTLTAGGATLAGFSRLGGVRPVDERPGHGDLPAHTPSAHRRAAGRPPGEGG